MHIESIRLLLVEDNDLDAKYITRVFARTDMMQTTIVRATSLSDALSKLEVASFDVILLDLGLPDSNGLQSIREIRERSPSTPIVVQTGDDHRETGFQTIAAGAQDFLSKNDLKDHLLTRVAVHAILRQKQLIQVQEASLRDSMTGIANRRRCDIEFQKQLDIAARMGTPFCVAIADIDHFKSINDCGGHDLGDRVIKEVAQVLHNTCRAKDMVARIGGEEFALIFPDTSIDELASLLQMHRRSVEQLEIEGYDHNITVSIGATYVLSSDDNRSAFSRADEALYSAKDDGRNQCKIQPAIRPVLSTQIA